MKNSLVKSLNIFFVFLLTIFIGTILTACLYVVDMSCKALVVGQTAKFFNFSYFVSGILLMLPIVCMCSGFFMCAYLIKHAESEKLPIIFYYVIYISTWLFLIPVFMFARKSYVQEHNFVQENANLSAGYFREQDDYIFYFSNVDENSADGLLIDLSDKNSSGNKDVYTFSNLKLSQKDGFKDSLIENDVKIPVLLQKIISGFKNLMICAENFRAKGYFSWLCFASLGLALASLAGLRNISNWKLLNLITEIFFIVVILIFNFMILSGKLFASFNQEFNGFFKFLPSGASAFLIITNLLCFIIFLVIGIIVGFVKNKNPKETQ